MQELQNAKLYFYLNNSSTNGLAFVCFQQRRHLGGEFLRDKYTTEFVETVARSKVILEYKNILEIKLGGKSR